MDGSQCLKENVEEESIGRIGEGATGPKQYQIIHSSSERKWIACTSKYSAQAIVDSSNVF